MGKDKSYSIYISIDDKLGAERSLRKFKRLCESFGVVREYRKRKEFKKPSIRKIEKLEAAEKRRNKTVSKTRRSSKI
ncbi:30S ribosomal protein S21 [Halobacteriovorax sp. HLS]|uniref:30S ribosomal protein S21 n=1 Tax=Halobacteriovorax sp. HLS TaxID=2234000 RepID=UPI000FD7F89B|nr:30S ribosomal protein S21 [Halobacteriovorax sp. HLS]